MITIREATTLNDRELAQLSDILIRVVLAGASVGWMDTPDAISANHYWLGTLRPDNVLLVAEEDGKVVGCAQLELAQRENGRHRAEVNKVLVHPDCQGRGVGRSLMEGLEAAALSRGRTLLHLDTDQADHSNAFYLRCGFTPIGTIPNWARSNKDGTLHGTTFYYKLLGEGPGAPTR